MGIEFRVTLYAESEEKAEHAAGEVFKRIADLEQKMSDYQVDSELNILCGAPPQTWYEASHDLFRVLQRGQAVARQSKGAFDITAGPIIRVWRAARRSGELPGLGAVREAMGRSGWRKLQLDKWRRGVWLEQKGMQLDLGGIAKGDACDQAILVLKNHGIRAALVEAGGDLKAMGAPPGARGWTISLPNGSKITIRDQAVSTSGDSAQFLEVLGQRYSHIVDPRTGYGLVNQSEVTVIGRNGLDTDPLATAISVLGPSITTTDLLRAYGCRAILKQDKVLPRTPPSR